MKIFAPTVRPTRSPWGTPDDTHEIAPGLWSVGTPSHGGFLISAERRAAMPAHLRDVPTFAGGNAYEEDCDVALVIVAFPENFTQHHVENAQAVILSYRDKQPDNWEKSNASALAKFNGWQAAARHIWNAAHSMATERATALAALDATH